MFALDLGPLQLPLADQRGMTRYVTELALAMARRGGLVDRFVLNPRLAAPYALPPELWVDRRLEWDHPGLWPEASPITYFLTGVFDHLERPQSLPPDLVPAAVLESDSRVVALVHDLIPLHEPHRLAAHGVEEEYARRLDLLRSADLVLTVSESSRLDVVASLGLDPAHVATIGGGAADEFGRRDATTATRLLERQLPEVRPPFVFTVAGSDPRKNTESLIHAFALLPPSLRRTHQLVVSCSAAEPVRDRWRAAADAAGLEYGQLLITGWIPDPVLALLYQTAELFVFPSLSEGLGLPVVEAMACGCPTIASSIDPMVELLGDERAMFAPDAAAISASMEVALTDPERRAVLAEIAARRGRELRWDSVVERVGAALGRLRPAPQQRRASAPHRRSRIAIVAPVPPTRTGVATHVGRVVRALGESVAVDVFVPDGQPLPDPAAGVERVVPARQLGTTDDPFGYDAIIYAVGNSAGHAETCQLLARYPGIVWLHDVRLPALQVLDRIDQPTEQAVADLEHLATAEYGPRAPIDVIRSSPTDVRRLVRAGVGFSGPIVHRATGIVVTSHGAARILRLDQPPGMSLPPIGVVPLSAPPPGGPSGLPSPEPYIVSLGIVDPVKAPATLVEAFARCVDRFGGRLVFVGDAPEASLDEVRDVADALGVGDRVAVTGWVPEVTYRRWLARAWIAVQLRDTAGGESSAAVLDALAAGVPVISNVPAAHELPPGTVRAVRPRCSPADLERELDALLTHEAERAELSRAGQAYAADRQACVEAAELLRFAASLAGSAP